jgi:colicin import membrane protein
MKKNIRVPAYFRPGPDGQASMMYPMAISMVGHVVFLLFFVITPGMRSSKPPASSVINVSMVSMKKEAAAVTTKSAARKTPPTKKSDASKKAVVRPPAKQPVKKTTPKVAPSKTKPKTSLKKKTFKATHVVKQAIEQLETKTAPKPTPETAAAESEPLQSVLERLRKEVGKAEAAKRTTATSETAAGQSGGKAGPINEDGKKRAELIDLYRLEIAFQVQKNWAFNQQLAGGDQSLMASIVFKVMPDGEVRDVFFTDRSGNTHLDESAYKAIVKSNPVDPHPAGLVQPYVEMGIRFTPEGIR